MKSSAPPPPDSDTHPPGTPEHALSRLQCLVESSDDVYWLADVAAQRLLYVSPHFEQLWGVPSDSLLQDPTRWRHAVIEEDAHKLPAPLFFCDGEPAKPAVREYRIKRPDGAVRWVRDRRFRFHDSQRGAACIGGIAEDVTDQKERELERELLLHRERAAREEAEALASSKDDFLAVVTHELRSPLNAIRGWAYVLRRCGGLSETQIKALDAIDRNTRTQAQMVDDLLDSQRILCGKLRLNAGCLPLVELIDNAVENVRPSAQAKHIRIDVAHDPFIGSVQVDPVRLSQALSNLLNNAVKFTPEEGQVRVRSVRRANTLAIEVQDTGIGLDPAQLAYVFDRFRQADTSNTRRQSGLGLGLSLARQLVELHGGRIDVHSDGVGHGSTFIIELPDVLMSASGAPLAGKRIVMVEDDADAREILELILRDAQAEPRCFDRASRAYRYLAEAPTEEQPDALISDIAMPDEDGYQFIKRVREMEDERHWPRLAALALTSFSRSEDRARALKAGFDAHLAKPIDSQAVVQTLITALRTRMQPDAEAPRLANDEGGAEVRRSARPAESR